MSAPKKIWADTGMEYPDYQWTTHPPEDWSSDAKVGEDTFPYILESEHERVKAQRDALQKAADVATKTHAMLATEMEMADGDDVGLFYSECAEAVAQWRKAIAACESDT